MIGILEGPLLGQVVGLYANTILASLLKKLDCQETTQITAVQIKKKYDCKKDTILKLYQDKPKSFILSIKCLVVVS